MVLDLEVQTGNRTAPCYAQPELAFMDRLAEEDTPAFLRGDSELGIGRIFANSNCKLLILHAAT
jgi:hypothetical protein